MVLSSTDESWKTLLHLQFCLSLVCIILDHLCIQTGKLWFELAQQTRTANQIGYWFELQAQVKVYQFVCKGTLGIQKPGMNRGDYNIQMKWTFYTDLQSFTNNLPTAESTCKATELWHRENIIFPQKTRSRCLYYSSNTIYDSLLGSKSC